MNYLQKIKTNRELKNQFKVNYPEGTIKWSNVSLEHFRVMSEVVYWFKKNGYQVYTEARLRDGSRPDIIAIDGPFGYIIEIIHSEEDKRFADKLDKAYGDGYFYVKRVYTKDFDYNTFKL